MDIRIIKSPTEGAKEILQKRIGIVGESAGSVQRADAVGLVQGSVIDMVCAADIAEKTVNVQAFDVKGVCPQHMTVLALFGDTAAVEDALYQIKQKLKSGKESEYML